MFLCFAIATHCGSCPWHSGATAARCFTFPLLSVSMQRFAVAELFAALRILCLTCNASLCPRSSALFCAFAGLCIAELIRRNADRIVAPPQQGCSFRRTAFAYTCNAPPFPTNVLPKPCRAKICSTAAEPCFAHANQCYAILFQCRSLHRRLGLCTARLWSAVTANAGVALPFLRNLGWSMLTKPMPSLLIHCTGCVARLRFAAAPPVYSRPSAPRRFLGLISSHSNRPLPEFRH